MTIKLIHLRKFLQFCSLDKKSLERALKKEIYADLKREDKLDESTPMDFYGCFWADAKNSVLHGLNLDLATADRIVKNRNRKRLYPILKKGFYDWWLDELRGTNLLVSPEETSVHARFTIPNTEITMKIENFLALKIGTEQYRLIYPYFSEKPPLQDKWIRIGLWLLNQALPQFGPEPMRMLDVQRGIGYSIISNPRTGNEQAELQAKCLEILSLWRDLSEKITK